MGLVVAIAALIVLLRDQRPESQGGNDAAVEPTASGTSTLPPAEAAIVVPSGGDATPDPLQDAMPPKPVATVSGCQEGTQLVAGTTKGLEKESGCAHTVDGGLVKEGHWIFVDPRGGETSGEFVAGKKEGKWTTWDPNGTVVKSEEFHLDNNDGQQIEWSPKGVRLAEREFKGGRLDGRVTLYLEDGTIVREIWKGGRRIDPPEPSPWPVDAS